MPRLIKFFAYASLIIAGLVIGVIALFWFVHRPLHQPTFFVRLTVNMTVDGEPVRIDRIIECRSYPVSGGDAAARFGRRTPTRHAATVGALGKSLSDGSAVMMWTPYLCARKKDDTTGKLIPWEFPDDHLPVMAWTPDAKKIEKLEVYPSPVYFRKSYARIRDVEISVVGASENVRADPPDKFEWFTNKPLEGENRIETPIYFVGYTVLALDERQWRDQSTVLDRALPSTEGHKILKPIYRIEGNRRVFDKEASKAAIEANKLFRKKFGPDAGISQVRINAMHLFSRKKPDIAHDPDTYPLIDIPTISEASVTNFDGKSLELSPERQQGFFLLTRITGQRIDFEDYRKIDVKGYNSSLLQDGNVFFLYDSMAGKLMRFFLHQLKVFPHLDDPFIKKGSTLPEGG